MSSSDRSTNVKAPLKPALASTRTARTPLTPRIAGNAQTTPPSSRPSAPKLPSTRTPVVSPRIRAQEEPASNLNVTPRSAARNSRVGVSPANSPSQDDPGSDSRPKAMLSAVETSSGKSSIISGFSTGGNNTLQPRARPSRPKSIISDVHSRSPPLVRSPGYVDLGNSAAKESIDSRFFHASDVPKQEPAPKRPEPKKTPSFFYADGKQDNKPTLSPRASSPVLSAVSEKRSSGSFIKLDSNPSKSPPMLSPSLASASNGTPFFAASTSSQGAMRSPSPSKENIHLSYRKGASQIIGMRPVPISVSSSTAPGLDSNPLEEEPRKPSIVFPHRKSPSVSSLDSGHSHQSRRRSATSADPPSSVSPLASEIRSKAVPQLASIPADLPSIDTSLASPAIVGSPAAFSPTKNATEFAAEARRERKVLDLEISNSSLLAINSSLEREVRRQKAELKRFRRLSRAGRFSLTPNELPRRISDGLDTLDEEDDEAGMGLLGVDDDDLSDSEEESSLLSGGEPLSPDAQNSREQDRLAKDEKRLRVDLEKHKELLVQSQSMNQSLKRCMYATEEMIREGKRALEYHVRVSDVKLGGRILSGDLDDEAEDIEVDDSFTDTVDDSMEGAKGLLDVWSGVGRRTVEGSEGSGDRDSGIEVDKPIAHVSLRASNMSNPHIDSGRPPDASEVGNTGRRSGRNSIHQS